MTRLTLRNGFEIYLKEILYNRILEEENGAIMLIFEKDSFEDFPFEDFQDLIYEDRLYVKKVSDSEDLFFKVSFLKDPDSVFEDSDSEDLDSEDSDSEDFEDSDDSVSEDSEELKNKIISDFLKNYSIFYLIAAAA